jgi:hypothetical protein
VTASNTNVSLTNGTITDTTPNGLTMLPVQYPVEPMLVDSTTSGAVDAAPTTASHIKLKNQTTYLLPRNTARTRKKKRRDVVGMHMTYNQASARWRPLQLPIVAADVFIKEVSWENGHRVFAEEFEFVAYFQAG